MPLGHPVQARTRINRSRFANASYREAKGQVHRSSDQPTDRPMLHKTSSVISAIAPAPNRNASNGRTESGHPVGRLKSGLCFRSPHSMEGSPSKKRRKKSLLQIVLGKKSKKERDTHAPAAAARDSEDDDDGNEFLKSNPSSTNRGQHTRVDDWRAWCLVCPRAIHEDEERFDGGGCARSRPTGGDGHKKARGFADPAAAPSGSVFRMERGVGTTMY